MPNASKLFKAMALRCKHQAWIKFDNTPGVSTDPLVAVYESLGDDFEKLSEMSDEELENFMDENNRYPGSFHG